MNVSKKQFSDVSKSSRNSVMAFRPLGLFLLALIFSGALLVILVQAGGSSRKTRAVNKDPDFWKNVNLEELELPQDINIEDVDIKVDTVDVMNVPVRYRRADPPSGIKKSDQILFLLHGAAFTSRTWVDRVPTMQTIASLGYRVIAIDLPGYGDTPRSLRGDRADFMEAVIKELCGDTRPVVVSPSMSGGFSLPLIAKNQNAISGYIPVAPVSTGSYSREFYESVSVPTMIVVGENDGGLRNPSTKALENIPTSTQPQVLERAGHPAYLDQPNKWHQLIYNFLKNLEE